MSPAVNGHTPPGPAARTRQRAVQARGSLRELQRLVRILGQQVDVGRVDVQRDLELLTHPDAALQAESRLRALSALLASLDAFQQVRGPRARPRTTSAGAARPAGGTDAAGHGPVDGGGVNGSGPVNGRPVNGRPVNGSTEINGRPVNGHANGTPGGRTADADVGDRELAAATARYIARDLAARQLSEFTSAEGYRLARALARLGGVEEPVERLLREANQVRLHPTPLADAVSHSPR